mmetsp:Transcript_76140/g.178641  ORF Transcript_76140/g.178641 Transcript_76140/m.178641 type:complete len:201 (+) Transcript_76140:710-1312(+)
MDHDNTLLTDHPSVDAVVHDGIGIVRLLSCVLAAWDVNKVGPDCFLVPAGFLFQLLHVEIDGALWVLMLVKQAESVPELMQHGFFSEVLASEVHGAFATRNILRIGPHCRMGAVFNHSRDSNVGRRCLVWCYLAQLQVAILGPLKSALHDKFLVISSPLADKADRDCGMLSPQLAAVGEPALDRGSRHSAFSKCRGVSRA